MVRNVEKESVQVLYLKVAEKIGLEASSVKGFITELNKRIREDILKGEVVIYGNLFLANYKPSKRKIRIENSFVMTKHIGRYVKEIQIPYLPFTRSYALKYSIVKLFIDLIIEEVMYKGRCVTLTGLCTLKAVPKKQFVGIKASPSIKELLQFEKGKSNKMFALNTAFKMEVLKYWKENGLNHAR